MPSRTRAREQALQILYLIDLADTSPSDALALFRENFGNDEEDFEFARNLVEGVRKNYEELDRMIEKCSQNWRIQRMPRIDRNILRLGAYELRYCAEIPSAVALNEAVELGKKYGDIKTGAFVNGILDRISREQV